MYEDIEAHIAWYSLCVATEKESIEYLLQRYGSRKLFSPFASYPSEDADQKYMLFAEGGKSVVFTYPDIKRENWKTVSEAYKNRCKRSAPVTKPDEVFSQFSLRIEEELTRKLKATQSWIKKSEFFRRTKKYTEI